MMGLTLQMSRAIIMTSPAARPSPHSFISGRGGGGGRRAVNVYGICGLVTKPQNRFSLIPQVFVCVCALQLRNSYRLFIFTHNQSVAIATTEQSFSCQKPYSLTLCISHTHPTPCDHTSLIQIGSTSLHTSESNHVWEFKIPLSYYK